MYDLIGDTHGHADELKLLLQKLGYTNEEGVWKHRQNRKTIFIGDYIDRGPKIREVLQIVKAMVDAGNAIALMGNHEYNALAYAQMKDGNYLREHSEKNNKQHQATLDQFKDYHEEWQQYLKWFYSLPLFIELDGFRAVHACWDDDYINWLKERKYFTMTPELLELSHIKNTEAYDVIDATLKGKEIDLPEPLEDKDGTSRTKGRYMWWQSMDGSTYGKCVFGCPETLMDSPIPSSIQKIKFYPSTEPPVFIGHYWIQSEFPYLQADNIACLDFSVAQTKPGFPQLVAYRWDGNRKLSTGNFVTVARQASAL